MRQQITACLRVSPVSRLGGLRPSTVRALSGARRPQRREMLGPPSFLQPGHGARDIGTISGGGDRISMHDAADKIERSMAVFCKHIKRFADPNSELIGSPSSPLTQAPEGLFQAATSCRTGGLLTVVVQVFLTISTGGWLRR